MSKSYLGMGLLSMVAGFFMVFSPDSWTKIVVIFSGYHRNFHDVERPQVEE